MTHTNELAEWEKEFEGYAQRGLLFDEDGNIRIDFIKSFIRELLVFERQKGREEVIEEIEHEHKKLLDGFGHPKDCEICKRVAARTPNQS